ncbi:MAG TPA: hypothetical protein DCL77_10395, partial [Prolixibacteraceae bacterium]|nr:hypothetical protein [Prolixibacteraceae bacterium]
VALDQVIEDRVLELEAQKQKLSVLEFKESLFKGKITHESIVNFAKHTSYPNTVPELRETLVFHDLNSIKGQELLMTRYKKYLLNQFVDSLKKAHQITILLKPPKPPKITINDLIVHYKGNLNSPVTFLVISDFDCHICKEQNTFLEKLFNQYKGKVRFGFTHYSSYVSNSAIASECSSNQGKFWEMHDSIFNAKVIPDSVSLFRMAKNLKLDMNAFGIDFKNKAISEKIKDNLLKLESAGIYGTPTIMINDRLIFNSTSINEIEKMLKEEIEKVN